MTELQDSGITDHALIETALAVYIHLIEGKNIILKDYVHKITRNDRKLISP